MLEIRNAGSIEQYVGVYLKREMKRRKITQEQFAELVHADPRTIRHWWKGEGIPWHILDIIHEKFNIPYSDIFLEWEGVPSFLQQNIFTFTTNRT